MRLVLSGCTYLSRLNVRERFYIELSVVCRLLCSKRLLTAQSLDKCPASVVEDDAHAVWVYTICEGTVAVAINNSKDPAVLLAPWGGAELLLATDHKAGVRAIYSSKCSQYKLSPGG